MERKEEEKWEGGRGRDGEEGGETKRKRDAEGKREREKRGERRRRRTE